MSLVSKPQTTTQSFQFVEIATEDEAAELHQFLGDVCAAQTPLSITADPHTFEAYALVVAHTTDITENLMYKISTDLALKVGLINPGSKTFKSFEGTMPRRRLDQKDAMRLKGILSGMKEPVDPREVGGLIGVIDSSAIDTIDAIIKVKETRLADAAAT